MKRNEMLLRKLLLHITEHPGEQISTQSLGSKYPYGEITEHLIMLYEEGLIEGELLTVWRGRRFIPHRVTSLGHKYLEATRPRTRREKFRKWLKPALAATAVIPIISTVLFKACM